MTAEREKDAERLRDIEDRNVRQRLEIGASDPRLVSKEVRAMVDDVTYLLDLAALRTETSKPPLGHEEEVDQWMYHVGPIPEGFTVEPVGIRTDGAGEQLDARVPLREVLAILKRDVMPDEIADEVEVHVWRALADCGEVDAHKWLKARGFVAQPAPGGDEKPVTITGNDGPGGYGIIGDAQATESTGDAEALGELDDFIEAIGEQFPFDANVQRWREKLTDIAALARLTDTTGD